MQLPRVSHREREQASTIRVSFLTHRRIHKELWRYSSVLRGFREQQALSRREELRVSAQLVRGVCHKLA